MSNFARRQDPGKKKSNQKIKDLIPLIYFSAAQYLSFSSKLCQFSKNFCFQANLAEKSNSSFFETISRFCSYLRFDANSTFQISRIHDNFSLEPILGQEVTVGTLSLGLEKPKFSKCSVSNQISWEGYL